MKNPKFSPASLIEPLEARIAPATVVPGGKDVTWTDIDGDTVKLHASKAIFTEANKNQVLKFTNSGQGEQLQVIDLTVYTSPAFLAGINLSVTVTEKGVNGDDKVNVGFIKAAIPDADVFIIRDGIDLGRINIKGDLGGIYAGDQFVDAAIQSIHVESWGKLNTAEQDAQDAGIIPSDLRSITLGPIKKINITGDFDGSNGARLQAVGQQFGRIGSLNIGGSLIGGAASDSGQIFVTQSIGSITIGGSIVGGAGKNSGSLFSYAPSKTAFGNISIGKPTTNGGIQGGAGENSGTIFADALGKVTIAGDVKGYQGSNSSLGTNSGNIQGAMTSLEIKGSLIGGSGEFSGRILSVGNGAIGSVVINQSIQGGSGDNTGLIIFAGNLGNLKIGHSIVGGTGDETGGVSIGGTLTKGTVGANGANDGIIGGTVATAASGSVIRGGFLFADTLRDFTLKGALKAGTVSGDASYIYSGAIVGTSQIQKLTIEGDVTGNETTSALIAARGLTVGKTSVAIKTLEIGGSVAHANILAGYAPDQTSFLGAFPPTLKLTPYNADAQIGTITVGGNLSATNIVAGAVAGTNGTFGDTNDARISGTGTSNRVDVISSIASIVIKGAMNSTSGGSFGIVADQLGSISIGGTAVALNPGANNDLAPVGIPGTTDFHAIELPAPETSTTSAHS